MAPSRSETAHSFDFVENYVHCLQLQQYSYLLLSKRCQQKVVDKASLLSVVSHLILQLMLEQGLKLHLACYSLDTLVAHADESNNRELQSYSFCFAFQASSDQTSTTGSAYGLYRSHRSLESVSFPFYSYSQRSQLRSSLLLSLTSNFMHFACLNLHFD